MKKNRGILGLASKGLLGLLALLTIAVALIYFEFRASLPRLEGQLNLGGVSGIVSLERDKNGSLTVTADTRADLAFGTGFVHAQERFFQMDLYRRVAAGELSELVGSAAFGEDEKYRFHRFRTRAGKVIKRIPKGRLELLKKYAAGVNAGLADLGSKPFEYWLLDVEPKAWSAEDTILVTYAMMLDLQDERAKGELKRSLLQSFYPQPVYDFLVPLQTEWDSTLTADATPWVKPTVPTIGTPKDLHKTKEKLVSSILSHKDKLETGSSNWAVSGGLTSSGSAIISNDMHLDISVPATWFRLRLKQTSNGLDLAGVSLPGTPLVIAGSNGDVAWGFTNNRLDTGDLVKLEINPTNNEEYLTPNGYKGFENITETIKASDGTSRDLLIKETIWGPVLEGLSYDKPLVIKWTGHSLDAINVKLFDLESITTVADALKIAPEIGISPQNALLADKEGNIAWTVFGRIPTRKSGDYGKINSWADGRLGWLGWTTTDTHPRVVNPADGRLWTANNRTASGTDLKTLGNERGFVSGARAQQIKSNMDALSKPISETDLFNIMFDNRAVFLQRWQTHILTVLGNSSAADLKAFTNSIENWGAAADPSSVGYRLVRNYRYRLYEDVMAPVTDVCRQTYADCDYEGASLNWETPLWQILETQPEKWLPENSGNWQIAFENAARRAWKDVLSGKTELVDYTWGEHTRAQFNHPLSGAVPGLGQLTDMPHTPQAGEHEYMPKVATRSGGQSEHMVVSPGHEEDGILNIPSGQSGHPLAPYYGAGHNAWLTGTPTPFLPQETRWKFTLAPEKN